MTEAVGFRDAELEDSASLALLNRALIDAQGHSNRMDVAALTTRMHEWLSRDYRAIVAVDDERIVGYVLFRDDENDRLHLRQLFVGEAWRRQGLGNRLVQACLGSPATRRRTRVEVLVGNTVGLAFWRSIGFADYSITLERPPS